ncbi:MAG: EAL domain-containing protein [Methylomonas sp.]|nr:EAL domain-containing protein [Methylomonas sp.]
MNQLSRDILIGVTAFFRDAEAFKVLEQEVIPLIASSKAANEAIRVWVAGCSTGEEAYSVAILLLEWFAAHQQKPRIQLFATDIDDDALGIARAGLYANGLLADVPEPLIARYFTSEKGGYRIAKSVRETIVFASHNLISDPPFSKLDLVVCRNLLIYINGTTQKKLLNLFHYVLLPGGYLFLGSSESIGNIGRHFSAVSKQWRIFRHENIPHLRAPQLPIAIELSSRRLFASSEPAAELDSVVSHESVYRRLIETHGPAMVLINAHHELLYVSGDISNYLTLPVGQASLDLFKMLNPALAMALRSVLKDVEQTRTSATVLVGIDDAASVAESVLIQITPISTTNHQQIFLICFSRDMSNKSTFKPINSAGDDWILQQLYQELNSTREDLKRTIEQSCVAVQEMKAANEEIMAMNEELQSANEELESSKEELQSLNEELINANAHLDAKVVETESLNTDLNNLFNSIETPILLLDKNLKIRRFTPAATQLMRLFPNDVGRAIDDIVHLFDDNGLSADCLKVMRGKSVEDREISGHNGHFYLRRITPYHNSGGGVSGVVLTFLDVTTIKQAHQQLFEHAKTLQWQSNLLEVAPVIARDLDDRIVFWNKGAEELFGWRPAEAMGRISHELLKTRFSQPLEKIKAELRQFDNWKGELSHATRDGAHITVSSSWTCYRNSAGKLEAIVEVNNDITARKLAETALAKSEAMFHTMVDWTYNWEYWLDPDGKVVYMTPSAERLTGYRSDEFKHAPDLIGAIVFQQDAHIWTLHNRKIERGDFDAVEEIEFRLVKKNGDVIWVQHTCHPVIAKDGSYLGRRITVRDISEQKDSEEQIRNLAYFDPLTNLPNRRLLMDRLRQSQIAGKRNLHYAALLMLDLDHFKSLNDSMGHPIGDCLLVEVGRRISNNVREEDTVSRLGGDEFVVLLEGLGKTEPIAAAQTEALAENLRLALNQPFVLSDSRMVYYTTPSIGLTLFLGTEHSPEVLIKQADVALYQAKDAGRNTVRYFNPAMQSAVDERTAIQAAIRQGLTRDEFKLHYQPQVDQDGKVVGAEALIRWQHPDKGLMTPDYFIELAEETGQIVQLGQWALDVACRQLKVWENDARYGNLYLSVNVSARQFHQPSFVEQITRIIEVNGANPRRLKLELTETVVLDNIDEVINRMKSLNEIGIEFALDDFGTGYSSLSYLKRLPLAEVKIDKSFVHDVIADASDAAIVHAILAMSQTLGLCVIAEGVETREQYDFLIEHGCRKFQGYLFGKPMPIESLNLIL